MHTDIRKLNRMVIHAAVEESLPCDRSLTFVIRDNLCFRGRFKLRFLGEVSGDCGNGGLGHRRIVGGDGDCVGAGAA